MRFYIVIWEILAIYITVTNSKFLIGNFHFKNGSEFDVTTTQINIMEKWVGNSFSFSVVNFFSEMCPALSSSLDYYTTVEIREHLLNIWNSYKIPIFTWQPSCYDPSLPTLAGAGIKAPDTFIKQFSTGQLDLYLTKVATEIKSYISGPDGIYGTGDDRRLYIRLGHEMNGNYYQWDVMANSKITSADYIAFWRYTRKFFDIYLGNNTNYIRRQVQWVWCPNNFDSANLTSKFIPAEELYPGNDVVDWMCTDVYNYADSFGGQDPIASDLIRPMLNRMHALAPGKPVMLGEFGIEYVPTALDDASRRTAWYQDLFTFANNNEIKLIAQFNFESNAVFGQVGVPNLDGYAQLLRNASWFLTANPSNPRLVDDSTFAGVSLPLISFSSPAPTGTPSSLSSSSSALSIGVIIGIAVGGGVGLILFIALLLYSKRHSSKLSYESERASENSSSVRSHENRPFRGIVNPELNSGFC